MKFLVTINCTDSKYNGEFEFTSAQDAVKKLVNNVDPHADILTILETVASADSGYIYQLSDNGDQGQIEVLSDSQYAIKKAIDGLPEIENLKVDRSYFSTIVSYKPDVKLTLKPLELNDALVVMERLNPDSITYYQSSCGTFCPDSMADVLLEKDPHYKSKNSAVNCCYLEIDGLRDYADEKKLVFFAWSNGELVEFNIPIVNDTDHYRTYYVKHIRGGVRIENFQAINKGGIFMNRIVWSSGSGEHPNRVTFY